MPAIICDNGHVSHYRNTRGSRIADMRCHCGSVFHRAQYVNGEYVRAQRHSQKALGKLVPCAVCGKKRREKGGSAKSGGHDLMALNSQYELVTIPAHATICWHHTTFPASCMGDFGQARPGGDYGHRPVCDVVAEWVSPYGRKSLLRYPEGWHQWHDTDSIERITQETTA